MKTRIFNLIILDESGSMQSIKTAALNGMNETLQSISNAQKKHEDQEHVVTLVSFNSDAVKTICDCGRKATVNARIDADGYVITEGSQVFLGGNDSYIAMCHKCYQDYIREHRKVELLHGTERDSE